MSRFDARAQGGAQVAIGWLGDERVGTPFAYEHHPTR
jgi:hypothetical protein